MNDVVRHEKHGKLSRDRAEAGHPRLGIPGEHVEYLAQHFASLPSSYAAWRNSLIFKIFSCGTTPDEIALLRVGEIRAGTSGLNWPPELRSEVLEFISAGRAAVPRAGATKHVFLSRAGNSLRARHIQDILARPLWKLCKA